MPHASMRLRPATTIAAWARQAAPDEEAAYLADIRHVVTFARVRVLDAGAGTGALCSVLSRWPDLTLTALEPSAAMLALLRRTTGPGRCRDRARLVRRHGRCRLFPESRFDVVASRQVVNGLFDPLAAFRHWHRWLRAGGQVVVIDGLYGREGWRGAWAEEVDVLPLAACQGMATVPYLLEQAGFEVIAVELMTAVNTLPTTRTPRYVVVARR